MSSFQERFKNKIGQMGKDGILGINSNNNNYQNNEVTHDDNNFDFDLSNFKYKQSFINFTTN